MSRYLRLIAVQLRTSFVQAMQYRADFLDWKTVPPATPETFRFVPPAGAKRIVFAAQLQRPVGVDAEAAP